MAKIKRRGEAGAAKNYITRTQALKKLQISLSDFRRLCILKGIYPREPTNKKKANKGSSAPASFYYSKDIMYLLHEPLLNTFRQHKTFAKKLAKAVGRGEWALAKGLESRKPDARLDHLIKERYPTFKAALGEMNDPLSLLSLFERLPRDPVPGRTEVPVEVTAECARLMNELKVWAIRTNALRRVFLSIKGIYYECEVPSGQSGTTVPVRWLEPYEFTQHVPSDVDFRILLTFLDLYRTLTSFVLYKLYTDENLVYPPPMDVQLDQRGEGVGKFKLVEREEEKDGEVEQSRTADGKKITKKDVKQSIKSIQKAGTSGQTEEDQEMEDVAETNDEPEEEFVHHPSKNDEDQSAPLPTYTSLLATSDDPSSSSAPFQIFSPYTFYLSRETSSRTWEFIIRAFGGKVVTDLAPTTDREDPLSLSSPSGDKITHVIIDRPMGKNKMKDLAGERKWVWVQPQWVADCANRREILPSGEGSGYEPGGALPPHLSPWDGEGEIERPWFRLDEKEETGDVEMDEKKEAAVEAEDDEEDEEKKSTKPAQLPAALLAASLDPTDATLMHQAELEAESLGQSAEQFKTQLALAIKSNPTVSANKEASKKQAAKDEDMRKIMMTGKKQRLYTKMKYSNDEKRAEHTKLEEKRMSIEKRKKKEQKAKLAAKAAA